MFTISSLFLNLAFKLGFDWVIKKALPQNLHSALLKDFETWAQEISNTVELHHSALSSIFQEDVNKKKRPFLYDLRRTLNLSEIPSIDQWDKAIFEHWETVRSRFPEEKRQGFFNQPEAKVKKQIHSLSEKLHHTCIKDRESYQTSSYEYLKGIKSSIENIENISKNVLPKNNFNDIRAAAKGSLKQWKIEYSFNSTNLIRLGLRYDTKQGEEHKLLELEEVCKLLRYGKQIILTGVPGAGKTITLLQIAEHLLDSETDIVPFLISLPAWAAEGTDIVTFIGTLLPFRAENITSNHLASLIQNGKAVFLLNGWNEISEKYIENVRATFGKKTSTNGLVVSTRESFISPPLQNPIVIHIAPLTKGQRKILINKLITSDPQKIITIIERNSTLDKITRTPLFLSAILELAQRSLDFSTTRYGILHDIVCSSEERIEHKNDLYVEPLFGNHRKYLAAIAALMTEQGSGALQKEECLSEITKINEQLVCEKQINSKPISDVILKALCDHHLLVCASSEKIFRFVHQQFQEWFAAERVYQLLKEICEARDTDRINEFKREIIDKPVWEESILFVAERIAYSIEENRETDINIDL
ncbi:MAG: hypothetical protein NT116_05705, partial [Candidatus Parcubacteria bacterium]|nr:hypothetical protein [Candidatus Parcubacteria bacterium]